MLVNIKNNDNMSLLILEESTFAEFLKKTAEILKVTKFDVEFSGCNVDEDLFNRLMRSSVETKKALTFQINTKNGTESVPNEQISTAQEEVVNEEVEATAGGSAQETSSRMLGQRATSVNPKISAIKYEEIFEVDKFTGAIAAGHALVKKDRILLAKSVIKKVLTETGFDYIIQKPDFEFLSKKLEDLLEEPEGIYYIPALNGTRARGMLYHEFYAERTDMAKKDIIQRREKLKRRAIDEELTAADDFSDRPNLKQPLDDYIAEHFDIVKVLRLEKRTGLIGARTAGAKIATGEVLIFFDSHIETNYNWLPPLLEPIAINPKASVCPFIDVVSHKDFEYRAQDEGARGAFDWQFDYKRLPLLPEDLLDRSKPFKSPIMAGGLFAIGADFFWQLGGYDEGLDIWGGEQYELSFKIWMCGGELLDAPCSRVAHIYRGPMDPRENPRNTDYEHKNYKRVAEVWMDEYKQYIYAHDEGLYETIDAGDISKQVALRKENNCKSFKWFMENVAFDLTKTYPLVEPPDFAYGTVQSLANEQLCVDTLNVGLHDAVGLYPCADNHKRPQKNQNWALSWHRDLRLRNHKECLDVADNGENAKAKLWECHGQGGNQFWYYDDDAKMLKHGTNLDRCLEADLENRKVYVNRCDEFKDTMKWQFGFVNSTALVNFNLKDE